MQMRSMFHLPGTFGHETEKFQVYASPICKCSWALVMQLWKLTQQLSRACRRLTVPERKISDRLHVWTFLSAAAIAQRTASLGDLMAVLDVLHIATHTVTIRDPHSQLRATLWCPPQLKYAALCRPSAF